jgi:hypothetical protein
MLKTSGVAAACLTLMSFLVACGGGAGSANSSPWEKAITPPKLTGISPTSGPTTGGTTVAITGTDFQKGASVVFGNVPAAQINSVTSTSIEAVTPVHDPGNVDVKVTNPDTRSDTLLAAFAFEGSPPPIVGPAPTVSSVLPNSGPVVGGTVVTITGTDFQSGATVTFGQSPATAVVFNSATQLQATTPAHAPGTVDVIVRNPDTQSATVSGGFTYQPVPAPTIISLLPTSGPEAGGTLVTVWGTNFLAGATVSFGGVAAASVTVTSATQLGAVTPPHATGVVDVRVTNPDDQFATLVGAFTYGTPPPAIISISPSSGTTAGGTSVTITGTGFQPGVPGTTVTFGGVAASGVNVISSTQIQAMTPAHDAGSVDVRVTNPDAQSATRVGGYVYVSGTAPTINSLSVDSGLSLGGTPVTITGSDFAGGATVTFGTLPAASVTVVSPTRIDVTTPSQAAGTIVDVTVTNPDTQQGTLPNAFRYGQVLFSDGFGTGDFSLWSSTYTQRHGTVAVDATLPHVGPYGADIHYNTWTTDCGGANSCDDNTHFTVNLGGSHGLDHYSFRGYVYMHINPGGATGIGRKLFRNETTTSGCGVGNVQESELTLLCNLTPVCSTNIIMTGCDADGTTSLGIVVNPPTPANDHRAEIAGGALAGRTYYFTMSWVSPGGEGMIGGEISHTISANKLSKLLAPDLPAGSPGTYTISGWNVYIGTTSGQTYLQNSTPMGTTTDWTEPSSCPTTCLAGTYLRDDLGIKTKATFPFDQWVLVENETQLNNLGSSNGYVNYWLDGTQIAHYEGINSRGTRDIGIKNFEVGRQTNRTAGSCGSPPCLVDENRYWDDVVIGDAYIGPQVPPP